MISLESGSKYTTIQITKEMNVRIRHYCKENGIIISTFTEKMWEKFMSGSILV